MRLSSSRLQVVSCIPRCVPVKTSAIGHGELHRLDILPSNQTSQGLFCGNVPGSFIVAVIRFGRSRVNVWQLWDDERWLRQICRNIARVRLPKLSTDILQQSVVKSLLFWDSSQGLNNICPASTMTMRSVVFTRTPTKSTHSPKLGSSTLQGLPFKRM